MENYLNKCLDSLIVENMKLIEVLIINDGSKDRSSEIAHEYANKYPDTYRVIDKQNGNYGSCINRGLKDAKGKYIKVLDADDYFDKTVLEQYINFLNNNDCDLILNNCNKVNQNGEIVGEFFISKMSCKTSFKKFARKRIFPQMHCIAYNRNKICKLSYQQTEGISYTDQEWVTIPMQNVESVINSNLTLYNYLIGREGQTINKEVWSKSFGDQKKVVLSIIKCVNEYNGDLIHKSYLMDKAIDFLSFLYMEHIINSIYNEDDFRKFDGIITNNYPQIYDCFDMVTKTIINKWRLNKSNSIYAHLCIWIKKNLNFISKIL